MCQVFFIYTAAHLPQKFFHAAFAVYGYARSHKKLRRNPVSFPESAGKRAVIYAAAAAGRTALFQYGRFAIEKSGKIQSLLRSKAVLSAHIFTRIHKYSVPYALRWVSGGGQSSQLFRAGRDKGVAGFEGFDKVWIQPLALAVIAAAQAQKAAGNENIHIVSPFFFIGQGS